MKGDWILWVAVIAIALQTLLLYALVASTHDESTNNNNNSNKHNLPGTQKSTKDETRDNDQCLRMKPIDKSNPFNVQNGEPLWIPKKTRTSTRKQQQQQEGKKRASSVLVLSCMLQDARALLALVGQLQCWGPAFDQVILTFPEYGRPIVEPFLQKWMPLHETLFEHTLIRRYYLIANRYELGMWCEAVDLSMQDPHFTPEYVVLSTDCLTPVVRDASVMEKVLQQEQQQVLSNQDDMVVGLTTNRDNGTQVQPDPFLLGMSIRMFRQEFGPQACTPTVESRVWGYQYPEDFVRIPYYRENFQRFIATTAIRIVPLYTAPPRTFPPRAQQVLDLTYGQEKPDKDAVKLIAQWKEQEWLQRVQSEQFPVAQTFGQMNESLVFDDDTKRKVLTTCLGVNADAILQWANESFAGIEDKPVGLSVC